jgi:hypothetical protein
MTGCRIRARSSCKDRRLLRREEAVRLQPLPEEPVPDEAPVLGQRPVQGRPPRRLAGQQDSDKAVAAAQLAGVEGLLNPFARATSWLVGSPPASRSRPAIFM